MPNNKEMGINKKNTAAVGDQIFGYSWFKTERNTLFVCFSD